MQDKRLARDIEARMSRDRRRAANDCVAWFMERRKEVRREADKD